MWNRVSANRLTNERNKVKVRKKKGDEVLGPRLAH